MSQEEPPKPSQAPPIQPPVNVSPSSPPSAMDRLIPASNADALASYYVGLFSIIPLFGLFMGPFAISKGRNALARTKEDPNLPGKGHARVGIGCGAIGLLFNLLIVGFILMLLLFGRK